MLSRLLLVGILAIGLPTLVHAEPYLSFAVSGQGGLAPATPAISDDDFYWIDNSGGVSGTTLLGSGFYPLPDPSWEGHEASVATGSLLLSSPFTLEDGDLFTLSMSLLTADDPRLFASQDVGFALLVQNNAVQAVLANLRPNGDHKVGTQAPPPEARFVGTSAGVSVTEVTSGPTLLTLGDNHYGQPAGFGDCFGNCFTAVTSSYTPGAGTYQLLLGIYSLTGQLNDGGPGDPARPSALTVNGVYITPVPEPLTLGLVGMGLLGLRLVRQRVRA